jgi:NAD(P)-dependent dehydrogenase (short-subunit alcohol dehydrogenase family)
VAADRLAIVSSVTGYGGMPTSAAYGATKAALINMAESLKFDLDKFGVSIQVINPGFVDTPATADNAFDHAGPDAARGSGQAYRARAEVDGSFEITFPRRFTYVLKAAAIPALPGLFLADECGDRLEKAAA